MSAEPFLNAMDDLFGASPRPGGSAAPMVRIMPSIETPASWQSPAAQALDNRQNTLNSAATAFANSDDDTKQRVDATGQVVQDGKKNMTDIKDDYKVNKSRLASASSDPEVAARMAQLDRVRTQDGANTVRNAQGRLPTMGGGNPLMSALPSMAAPMAAPMGAMPQMLGAPMQALSPLSSVLSGLTIPKEVTRPLSPGNSPSGAPADSGPSGPVGSGPEGIRNAIKKALDIKGITDPRARQNWSAGLTTIAGRESNFNVNAVNNWDINARNGNPSEGAFQMIRTTFAAHHEPGTSTSLRDPIAQAAAVINYVQDRYGVAADGSNFAARVQQADPTRSPKGY